MLALTGGPRPPNMEARNTDARSRLPHEDESTCLTASMLRN